jgi:hypothetical protein
MVYLSQRKLPALIACPIRGRTGGTRALCRGNKSYTTRHTFKGQNKRAFTAKEAGPKPERGQFVLKEEENGE